MGWIWGSSSSPQPVVELPPHQPAKSQPPPLPSPSNSTLPFTRDPEVAKLLAQFHQEEFPKDTKTPTIPSPLTIPAKHERHENQQHSSWLPFASTNQKSFNTPQASGLSSSTTASHGAGSAPWPRNEYASTFDDERVEDATKPSPVHASLGSDMSCRTAFDYAFHCNSLGGQWNAIYRHGSMQSCSEQWQDFWFCMRTRTFHGKAKEDAYHDFYLEKERRKYEGLPSSEDVWQSRKHLVRDDTFLTHPLPSADQNDEDWKTDEIRKRKAIRDKLGLGPESGTHAWGVQKDS